MQYCDVAVIGGGVLGCFAARNLMRWDLSAVLIETAEDVCTGITRANSAIVYAGYDNQPGSRKARMTVAGNRDFDRLCRELEVPFCRRGSLMVSTGPRGEQVLRKKLAQGLQNGVPGLALLSGDEARAREPMLSSAVIAALYAPTTGTVNPWALGIAAFENARDNGCQYLPGTAVADIHREDSGYVIDAGGESIHCKAILNCAGLQAPRIQELLFPPSVRLDCDGADVLVLDALAPTPRHILFQETEEAGKGITAVPTVEGNLLLGPSRRPLNGPLWATTREGMDFLAESARQLLPSVALDMVIRSFASVRPNPRHVVLRNGEYVPDGTGIGSFVIENPAPGFYSLIGIKTPGLTCADQLGQHLAGQAARFLNAPPNPDFDPHRKAIPKPDDPEIVCQCEGVTRSEILEAIRRGAATVDGVKRRVGSGMGRCQGSRCSFAIEKLLEEARHGAR